MPVLGQRLSVARPFNRIGQEEFRGGHAERIEQMRLLELIERLAGCDLDDAAENVDRMPVIPQRARLLGQRHLGQPLDKFGIVEIAEINAVIGGLDQSLAIEAVGDAGRVQQQILDVDRPAQGYLIEHRPAGFIFSLDPNLHGGERWNVSADGIIERDLSPIDQHDRRHAGNGLGNRADREAAVVGVAISTSRLPKHLKYTG